MSPKGVLPVIKRPFSLGSTQNLALEDVPPSVLEETSVKLPHEIIESEGTDSGFVGTIPVFDAVILNPHDDGGDLFVGLDFLMEEVGFAAFAEILALTLPLVSTSSLV